MADLVAQGPKPADHWQRPLLDGKREVLGRAAGIWTVPWDPFLSRRHAEIILRGDVLEVRQLGSAQNPLLYHGSPTSRCTVSPGDHFVIGRTTFTFSAAPAPRESQSRPSSQHTFHAKDLGHFQYKDANQKIKVLSKLPDLIAGAANERELFLGLSNLLMAGVERAAFIAIVAFDPNAIEGKRLSVLHWDQRRGMQGSFRPSERLIQEAIARSHQSVVYVWSEMGEASMMRSLAREGCDWAFCTPILEEAGQPWGVYAAGSLRLMPDPTAAPLRPVDLEEDVRFTELVAEIVAALRRVRLLERRHSSLSQFFSPAVLSKFAEADPEKALAPRECEVTVLFCDLRGFSRDAESHSDHLLALLERVSKALGVMTNFILDEGGVVGDFQGDAAMGFWGWPIDDPTRATKAILAALSIRQHFEAAAKKPNSPLAAFRVGIGVASGRAVAGKIGTADQAKVGVFGPIVNLASRLEGMSKLLAAPILIDEPTARWARKEIPAGVGRLRRVAKVIPVGMETPLEVTELLPPENEWPELKDSEIAAYESALDAFTAGEWARSLEYLHQVPPTDRVKDFLTAYIVGHNRVPPPGWAGVIPLFSKQ